MPSAWITHVKEYAKKNNCSYKEALSKASASYKKGKGVCDTYCEEPKQEKYKPSQSTQPTLTESKRNPKKIKNTKIEKNKVVKLQPVDRVYSISEETSSKINSELRDPSSRNYNNLNQPSSRRSSVEYSLSGNGKKKNKK